MPPTNQDPSLTLRLPTALARASASLLLLTAAAGAHDAPVRDLTSQPARPDQVAGTPSFDARAICAPALGELLFDQTGAALWARGTEYKARFDGRGATVIPFFGKDAPKNYPIAFEVASATLGGAPLASAAEGNVSRDGNVVRIDHGSFVEEYELEARSLEQRFVFASLPGSGDLSVRLAVDTELASGPFGKGLRFQNELGHVDYSEAYVLDAAGRRAEMESALVDGGIELRVPSDFVAAADFPLVIDPLVTFFTVAGNGHHEILPDVSYDLGTDRWCIVWSDIWSAEDYDVFARLASGAGQLLDTLTIDFTTDSWIGPVVANNNNFDQFLVCASVLPSSGVAEIRGRYVFPATLVVGNELFLTPADGAYRNGVDVGGDSFDGASRYCVVWQRYVNGNAVDIECRTLNQTGALGPIQTLNTTQAVHLYPSISNTVGQADGMEAWSVAWQTRHSLADNDIYGTQLNWDGSIRYPMFPIQTSTWNETKPSVATMLDPTGVGGDRPYMVVYERDYGSDHDVLAALLVAGSVLVERNVVGDFHEDFWYRDQRSPAIDSDGARFLVAFDERLTVDGPNPDVYTASYTWLNGALLPCEAHASFAGSPATEGDVALHSMASTGGPAERFFGTWVYESANNGFDVQGGLWDVCSGPAPKAYCFGDGSLTPCPCANHGALGHGCANSVYPGGASLGATGDASVGSDSLVLEAHDTVPHKYGIFFQGNTPAGDGAGVPFGDGLRCAAGNVVRIETRLADANGTADTTLELALLLGVQPGDIRYYQWWYRDPIGSPCGAKFNLSNGLEVQWMP